jgi:serine/threonine-protein kinase
MVPGTVYRVVRVLGAGGMATIYEVEDTTVGKHYVLKALHAELAGRADLNVRMAKEARTLARLQHPNIVEVVTAGTTQDDLRVPYIVMEKLNGHSLRNVLKRKGRLPAGTVAIIGIELLAALEHAHSQGVVHRDVKPDNVLIHRTRDGGAVIKLLDFGIMKIMTEVSADTGQRFIGTFRYGAPEQLRGEAVTPSSDLYAVGLVLYELLSGRGPFDDEAGEIEIAAAHLDRRAPLLPPDVAPPRLAEAVDRALAKDPHARHRSAAAFADALRAFVHMHDDAAGKAPSAVYEGAISGMGSPAVSNAEAERRASAPELPPLREQSVRAVVRATRPRTSRSSMVLTSVVFAASAVIVVLLFLIAEQMFSPRRRAAATAQPASGAPHEADAAGSDERTAVERAASSR